MISKRVAYDKQVFPLYLTIFLKRDAVSSEKSPYCDAAMLLGYFNETMPLALLWNASYVSTAVDMISRLKPRKNELEILTYELSFEEEMFVSLFPIH